MTQTGANMIGVLLLLQQADPAPPTATIRARVFQVQYRANDDSLPLSGVELWYTHGSDPGWHRYGSDDDRQSPMAFMAPDEGSFGLYLVLSNGTGASALPPTASTPPHLRVFVDYSAPTVQCHALSVSRSAGRRVVHIRWSAADKHLAPRPVELAYRVEPSTDYHPISEERQSNTGRFDWLVDDAIEGAVTVRVVVHDRAGNSTEVHTEPLALPPTTSTPALKTATALTGISPGEATGGESVEAGKLLREARGLRAKGDREGALDRLRQAVRLSPSGAEVIAELGAVLYDLRDFDRARDTYGLALERDPDCVAALEGLACVHLQKMDFHAAGEALDRIVSKNPLHARTWMNLGDVALRQGDELRAREMYHRAATVDPSAVEVLRDVQKRLENMEALSRRYRASATPESGS